MNECQPLMEWCGVVKSCGVKDEKNYNSKNTRMKFLLKFLSEKKFFVRSEKWKMRLCQGSFLRMGERWQSRRDEKVLYKFNLLLRKMFKEFSRLLNFNEFCGSKNSSRTFQTKIVGKFSRGLYYRFFKFYKGSDLISRR